MNLPVPMQNAAKTPCERFDVESSPEHKIPHRGRCTKKRASPASRKPS